CSTRLRSMARQMRPRPCLAMKLIASGEACSAGMTRSPAFSRSSSSTRMIMRPRLASSMISGVGEMTSSNPTSLLLKCRRQQARNISGDQVDFQVDPVARLGLTQIRRGLGDRDDVDPEDVALYL